MLSINDGERNKAPLDEPNVALAPEEIETLQSLVSRYEQVLVDIDHLSDRLQDLLNVESPPKELAAIENQKDGFTQVQN